MADPIEPDADAPGDDVPDWIVSGSPTSPAEPEGAPEPGLEPRKTFEVWAAERHPCHIDPATGRAAGVNRGKRLHRAATNNAALVNAARSYHRIPIGRLMTEAEYDDAIKKTASIVIK